MRDTSKLSNSPVTIYNEEVRYLLAANKGRKREKSELKEDPNKGVYIKVFSSIRLLGKGNEAIIFTARSTSSAIQGVRSNLFVSYSQKTIPEITD